MSTRISASPMWNHFSRIKKKAICLHCSKKLSMAGSTGNLKRHLKSKHPTIPFGSEEPGNPLNSTATIGVLPLDLGSQQNMPVLSIDSSPVLSVNDDDLVDCHQSVGQHKLTCATQQIRNKFCPLTMEIKKNIDLQLIRLICSEYHSFSMVEDPEFQRLIMLLNENYTLPSRKTLMNCILPSLCNDILSKIKVELALAQAVSITCDCWTNISNVSFYALTAHYINANTQLQSCLIECSDFSERHTSKNILLWITNVLMEFDLDKRISGVVTDDIPNIKTAIAEFNLQHISCFAQTLNLIVKNAIALSISEVIEKAKVLVQYFKQSAMSKLLDDQISLNKDKLKLKEDVPTIWNSTYIMLDRLVKNKEPILSAIAVISSEIFLSAEEWTIIEISVKILSVFDEVTKELSTEKTVSLSKTTVITKILLNSVRKHIRENLTAPFLAKKLASELETGLMVQFSNQEENSLVRESIILDPRFKKRGFSSDEKFEKAYDELCEVLNKMADQKEITVKSERNNQPCSSSLWEEFDKEVSNSENDSPSWKVITELDKYLDEPYLARTEDPLVWWNHVKDYYPNLYELAIKCFCIPATSVPSERIFTKVGNIITEKRSLLSVSEVKKIVFINQNFKYL